jgi:hypothetical protein
MGRAGNILPATKLAGKVRYQKRLQSFFYQKSLTVPRRSTRRSIQPFNYKKEEELMALSRRRFLKAGTSIALAAAIPLSITGVASGQDRSGRINAPTGDFPLPQESYQDPVIYFRKSTFSPYLNTTFQIHRNAAPSAQLRRNATPGIAMPGIAVTLINVADAGSTDGRRSDGEAGKECFSLIFRASGKQALKQNIYIIEHGALGKFALFLTPAGTDTRGRYYEAVINHRRP